MKFIEQIKQRASIDIKTIVLPEAEDIRTLKATEQVLKENYANIILIGNEDEIKLKAEENNISMFEAITSGKELIFKNMIIELQQACSNLSLT
ncbi:MAG: phosphate acetyltransferase, partial [Romboutsia sp.]|nr:phosphate acetyltransferase [Romboutsia sp.]